MIRTMKKALKYAMDKSEDPPKIKEHVEEYFNTMGEDRRYKLKWRAVLCNHKYIFSGIFEFAGQKYYFSKMLGKIELERI